MRIQAFLLISFLLCATSVAAADVVSLATCATKVFTEIGRSHKWSGKAPAGCPAGLAVAKQGDGVLVTAWSVSATADGWVQTGFSAAVSYAELNATKTVAAANADIMNRAKRLSRCLSTLHAGQAPSGCQARAVIEYLASEETGVKDSEKVMLDDQDRYAAVEYIKGDTLATPTPPDDADEGDALPPGVQIRVFTAPPSGAAGN